MRQESSRRHNRDHNARDEGHDHGDISARRSVEQLLGDSGANDPRHHETDQTDPDAGCKPGNSVGSLIDGRAVQGANFVKMGGYVATAPIKPRTSPL
jgi:hypothetical protein